MPARPRVFESRDAVLAVCCLMFFSTRCRYSAQQFATQRKLVFAYTEEGAGANTTFAQCNSGAFTLNYWLFDCLAPLADAAGGDAAAAGCTCQMGLPLSDGSFQCANGNEYENQFHRVVATQPGHTYYVVIQANPPDTGEDAWQTVTVAALQQALEFSAQDSGCRPPLASRCCFPSAS